MNGRVAGTYSVIVSPNFDGDLKGMFGAARLSRVSHEILRSCSSFFVV